MARTYPVTRFSEIEQDADGTWAVVNLVTGLEVRVGLSYADAKISAREIGQGYAATERKAGW